MTGYTSGGLDGNTNAGCFNTFVVKHSSGGIKQWTELLGSNDADWGFDITTNSSGNVFVTGETHVDHDGNTSAGHSDSFVVKYDTDGNKN